MTSIEWLWNEIDNLIPYEGIAVSQVFNDLLVKAKEMHKQEIIDAYNKSFELRDKPYSTADKYYQETFVSKGSVDHISDISKMVEVPKQEKDIKYWKNNCEEDYMTTPISVLRYISELEKLVASTQQETLYTEEQVREAIKMAKGEEGNEFYDVTEYSADEIIESIKQPKKD